MQEFLVPENHIGNRADKFIAEQYKQFSRSSLERLFEEGFVSVGDKTVKPSYKLKNKDMVSVDETKLKQEPEGIDLPVLYDDENVLVVNKPEGVLTHSKGAINDEATVATFLKPKLPEDFREGNRAGIVHRLDRATSGIIILAKNSAALSKLQKQFSTRKVKKTYLAVVEGVPSHNIAVIDVPIERNPKRPQTFRVSATGKPSSTEYSIIKKFSKGDKDYAYLELRPSTGRTHQLRVHLSYIKTPIVGDRIYGSVADHMYLHARSLEITLPNSERKVFEAELPDYFKDFIDE
jgi:23S rRNA pseudouridine1911/1915/1917 synthase